MGAAVRTTPDKILAHVESPARRPTSTLRALRRVVLDFREASRPSEAGEDPAVTVRLKYDAQAPYYQAAAGLVLEEALKRRILERVAKGGKILVAGSGAGHECCALAREGYAVSGVDFSEEMVRRARAESLRQGLVIEFQTADLRRHQEPPGSLAAVVFTYEVYSFLPDPRERVEMLRSMSRWLLGDGRIFLSARRLRGAYEALVLTAQWLAVNRKMRRWGDTHTRWIGREGEIQRSFLHFFREHQLLRECREAGLQMGRWEGGHAMLSPESGAARR
jgi:2-polyprenyl-3-methyl-5-hydroxy-6-metoxy-1,4-benzoquinol methylase